MHSRSWGYRASHLVRKLAESGSAGRRTGGRIARLDSEPIRMLDVQQQSCSLLLYIRGYMARWSDDESLRARRRRGPSPTRGT